MEANYAPYEFAESLARMDEILAVGDASTLEVADGIPSRDRLTYTNGFYAYCSALYVDMRGSAELVKKHRLPTLARLYRAYVSEMTAVLRNGSKCQELSIHGDAVWAVYDTTRTNDIDDVFCVAAQANSLSQILSHKVVRAGFSAVRVGIGLSYGRVLMIKAGYKGSGIQDIVWMGDVVNDAAHLSKHGNRVLFLDRALMVSAVFNQNLNDQNSGLLTWNSTRNCYHGDVINVAMNDWLKGQS